MKTWFVGFDTLSRVDAGDFLPEISAPSNWKDITKINEYLLKNSAKQLQKAGTRPLSGQISSIVILDEEGESKYVSGDEPISEQLAGCDRVVCVEASTFRSLMIAECIDKLGQLPLSSQWIVTSSLNGIAYLLDRDQQRDAPKLIDPLHAITGSAADDCSDIELVAKRYGIELECPNLALARVKLGRGLAKKLGMI